MPDTLIVGGGASGLLAAIVAARRGASVLVVERMARVGKKLLATGNGRCNLTNVHLDATRFHGADSEFTQGILSAFDQETTRAFFEDLGLATHVEDEGKVFPICGQASSVLDVLRYEIERLGVEVLCGVSVHEVGRVGDGLRCACSDGVERAARAVLVAAGGKSSPNMGSNGGGFKIAQRSGHAIVEPVPALTQITLQATFLRRLKGLKIEGAAELRVSGATARRETGELLFAEYGVSGPPILQLSRLVAVHFGRGNAWEALSLHLDLFPDDSAEELRETIDARLRSAPDKSTEFSFVGLLHKRLIPVILNEAGVKECSRPCGELSPAEVERIAGLLKDWPMRPTGTQSWMHSQVTAGGVDTQSVDPATLESKIVPGLFFAGETLDVDGDCGGYNLQWAWSSGYVAGLCAFRK